MAGGKDTIRRETRGSEWLQFLHRTGMAYVRLCVLAMVGLWAVNSVAQEVDSDADGLSDALELRLLVQFAPTFMTGRQDCSNVPAEFQPGIITPTVLREDGSIYGQVTPAKGSTGDHPMAEIHFYHLWRRDCGGHGHLLDTEHVAALIQSTGDDAENNSWKAVYWYAAAHENTVCDVSQIARAKTLHAEEHGPVVWVSPGKHASYLNETLCQRGCGADRCVDMQALAKGQLLNLGEVGHPMNESAFIASSAWPLQAKMRENNFPEANVARLNALPENDIAWFNPGRHPAQGVISISAATEDALAKSGSNTTAAISVAGDSSGNALDKSYARTKRALGTSARHVGHALHLTGKEAAAQEQ